MIDPAPGAAIDLVAIPRSIRDSGFTPRKMHLRASGKPTAGGFHIGGYAQPLPLEPGSAPPAEGALEVRVHWESGPLRLEPEALPPIPLVFDDGME